MTAPSCISSGILSMDFIYAHRSTLPHSGVASDPRMSIPLRASSPTLAASIFSAKCQR